MSLPLSLLICLSVFQLCSGTESVEEDTTAKKMHLLEGWFEKRPESKDVQKAAQYAVEMYNKNSKDKELFKLVSIHSAKSQVTNMINFKIIAILGRTKCPKMKILDFQSCALDTQQIKCQFMVTFDPHNNKYEMSTKICHKVAQKG